MWDFGGELRFRFIFPNYICGAMGGILMYDITEYSSFTHISDWVSIMNGAKDRIPLVLVGSKLDLDVIREVSFTEGRNTAKEMGFDEFIECSSKTGENVEKSFEILTRMMLKRMG
jgi:small GTP-binding protein